MIPPKQNAAFVAAMEDILDVYQRPYDAKRPLSIWTNTRFSWSRRRVFR